MTFSTARSGSSCVVLACAFTLSLDAGAKAGDTTITGFTEIWKPDGSYENLPGVEVAVYRNGNYVMSKKSEIMRKDSIEKAVYNITVTSGEPVYIVYYLSNKHVPVVQYLSARDDYVNVLHVCLLLKADYKAKEARNELPPLSATEALIRSIIRKDNSPTSNQMRDKLNSMKD